MLPYTAECWIYLDFSPNRHIIFSLLLALLVSAPQSPFLPLYPKCPDPFTSPTESGIIVLYYCTRKLFVCTLFFVGHPCVVRFYILCFYNVKDCTRILSAHMAFYCMMLERLRAANRVPEVGAYQVAIYFHLVVLLHQT